MPGEYIASFSRNRELRRWWNGQYWSHSYYDNAPETTKRRARRMPVHRDGLIEWIGLVDKPDYPFPPPDKLKPLNEDW